MEAHISAFGAVTALIVAIILIFKKVPPVYGMILGALVGGLLGGADLTTTVDLMVEGTKGIIPAVLRILAAGILAGVLIQSGAALVIAESIVKVIGENKALLALIIATMILTTAGVFIDVAIITVAPIALAIGSRVKLSKTAILLAMIGGGKAGNIMSPNPNTIAASEAFGVPLTAVMTAGIIPAFFGVFVTFLIANRLKNKGSAIELSDIDKNSDEIQPFLTAAIVAPLTAMFLLALRPLFDIVVDPMIALPLGGIVGAMAMGKLKKVNDYAITGLGKMTSVAVMLLGTGSLAGIIANSGLKDVVVNVLGTAGLPAYILAPVSGAVMSAATASTTAGTVVASNVFGPLILELGVAGLAGAAMVHAGATVFDHLPHGSFFHATGGSVFMDLKERMRLIPYETLVGFTLAIISTIVYGVFGFFM